MNKKLAKESGGITLIALVITVIVLLILAGISISMLSGDNSILSRAGEARDSTKNKEIEEKAKIAYAAALTMGKGTVTEELFDDELEKAFGENGYELSTDEETKEWVVTVDSVEGYRVSKGSITFGLQSDGSFIGQKSTYAWTDDETGESGVDIHNTQTSNPIADGTGYRFVAGHFVYAENYTYYVYNSDTDDWDPVVVNVYLCWDSDDGTIDVFSPSGAWLSSSSPGSLT